MSGSLLIAATSSDAGKSVVTTALCRAFARRGLSVAPFKAQNMSNNSMVTAAGTEIGRAQWVQALAAGAEPEDAMNPVLLKPGSDRRSHVVVRGRPYGTLGSGEFAGGRAALAEAAFAAYDELRVRFDVVVCEGAGSTAEINLRDWDYVNLGLAQHDAIPTVVVGDIDRGGVFAALYGSVALLEEEDQALVAGFVVNKFRGDVSLLAPGLDRLTALTGRPTYGVLPHESGLWLDAEDAVALEERPRASWTGGTDRLRVAVVGLPRISNFTDVDALTLEPDVDVDWVRGPAGIGDADLVVVPGTRATLADLRWLRTTGLAEAIAAHAERGGAVLGICGGAQMLGRVIADPDGTEGEAATVDGLGLVDAATRFGPDKALRLAEGRWSGEDVTGYEIHHGRLSVRSGEAFPGGVRDGAAYATMWHGTLESDGFRRAFLAAVASGVGRDRFESDPSVSFASARQERIDRLADGVEKHLDVDALLALVRDGVPAGLPTLAAGPVVVPPQAPPGSAVERVEAQPAETPTEGPA
ncbi:adenosylcobyric acid synthase [Mumia flava]|uniref:Cobyric acid synthase n=1 Tax=Mumia flava TaxID=1348852 RepID=A0A2M9BJ83_9ACTN|nr:cobyric acid synthase [Mumia flava]PJJ58016.1 adenosylcobyric acid synthase [Mumia flava]